MNISLSPCMNMAGCMWRMVFIKGSLTSNLAQKWRKYQYPIIGTITAISFLEHPIIVPLVDGLLNFDFFWIFFYNNGCCCIPHSVAMIWKPRWVAFIYLLYSLCVKFESIFIKVSLKMKLVDLENQNVHLIFDPIQHYL